MEPGAWAVNTQPTGQPADQQDRAQTWGSGCWNCPWFQGSLLGLLLVLNLRLKPLLSPVPGLVDSDMETETDKAGLPLGARRVPFHSLRHFRYMWSSQFPSFFMSFSLSWFFSPFSLQLLSVNFLLLFLHWLMGLFGFFSPCRIQLTCPLSWWIVVAHKWENGNYWSALYKACQIFHYPFSLSSNTREIIWWIIISNNCLRFRTHAVDCICSGGKIPFRVYKRIILFKNNSLFLYMTFLVFTGLITPSVIKLSVHGKSNWSTFSPCCYAISLQGYDKF